MSNYNYAYGTVYFSKVGYKELMRHMRVKFNDRQEFLFNVAVSFYDLVKSKKIKFDKAIDWISEPTNRQGFSYGNGLTFIGCAKNSQFQFDWYDFYFIKNEIFRGKTNKSACKPRKSAFKKLTNKQSSFELPGGLITLCEVGSTLNWNVEENNRAVEAADEDDMAKQLFKYLNSYKWRKAEGGVIWYCDEYMGEGSGHSSNRTPEPRSYLGPVGKKERDERNKALAVHYR